MFKISNDQISKLNSILKSQLINRLENKIEQDFPEKYNEISTTEWKYWIDSKISDCIEYGIIEEEDVKEYIEISICYPLMEARPRPVWIEELLINDNRLVDERFDILIDKLEFN